MASRAEPLVGIVMPAYNAERFLATTLDSILAQTEQRWGCLVVDDGSTDATAEIASQYAARDGRIRLLQKSNGGPSSARNAGFRALASTYTTFMDCDDVWLPHALTTLVDKLESSPDAVGSHALAEYINAAGNLVNPGEYSSRGRDRVGRRGRRLVSYDTTEPTDFDILINGNVLFPPGLVLARHSAYLKTGPFDESFKGPEDWDMLIRLSRHGVIEFVDDVILYYRRHDSNLGAESSVAEQAWLVRCKAFHSPENTRDQQRAAVMGWRAYQRLRMGEAGAGARGAARARNVRAVVRTLATVLVLCVRYARGFPLPRVRSERTSW